MLCCLFIFFTAALWLQGAVTGTPNPEKAVLLLWWNVENLFDADNDPATEDDDFTPEGKLQWTEKESC